MELHTLVYCILKELSKRIAPLPLSAEILSLALLPFLVISMPNPLFPDPAHASQETGSPYEDKKTVNMISGESTSTSLAAAGGRSHGSGRMLAYWRTSIFITFCSLGCERSKSFTSLHLRHENNKRAGSPPGQSGCLAQPFLPTT